MKVIHVFVMLMALVLIAGCGQQQAPEEGTSTQQPTEGEAQSPEEAPGEESSTGEDAPQGEPEGTTSEEETTTDETTEDTQEIPSGTESLSGDFKLLISDAPADIEDFESVDVTLSKTRIFSGNDSENSSEEGFEEKEINATVDLTQVIGNKSIEVLSTELESGKYNKIELYVESVGAKTTEGEEANVKIPSEKLQITKPFEVVEGEVTSFIFDINVVKKGQGNEYNLLPVISESGVANEEGELVREEVQEQEEKAENATEEDQNATVDAENTTEEDQNATVDTEDTTEEDQNATVDAENTTEVTTEETSLDCPGSNPASGSFDIVVSKMGVKKEGSPEPVVEMEGTTGTISIAREEPFEAKMGVDWYQIDLNVHKEDCDGELVETLPFRWEDGDQDKSKELSVPEEGCYCIKVTEDDLSVKNADISMENADEFNLDFSTQ